MDNQVKVYFNECGVVLGTAEAGFSGDYVYNEYRAIPVNSTRRADLRGLSAIELAAAGWRFIS